MNGSQSAQSANSKPQSILFLCGMNAIRSPMAEALARSLLPNDFFVSSAGVIKGERDPFVTAILEERGLSIPAYEPHALDELGDDYFDVIVSLSPEAHERALELTRAQSVEVEYWPSLDPSTTTGTRTQILDAYRGVRDQLEARIRQRFGDKIV